jgi:hypothetical protein
MFGDAVSPQVHKACDKEPNKKFKCRHVVVPSQIFEYKSSRGKPYDYTSLVVEIDTEHIIEKVGVNYFPYCVPRWHTMAGSAYGLSMATMVLLPDGRTMQSVVRTIRQAGEKYVDPPMVAVADAIRGDVASYPGGLTTADIEYDERLGEVLRPISQDSRNMPVGFDIANQLREDIAKGFFLDKLNLPPPEGGEKMTAYEVQRRISEHIRAAAPIFEPIEQDYSAPLMDGVFNLMKEAGAFPIDEMPETLSDADIKFTFSSPLSDMADEGDAQAYLNVVNNILAPLTQIDPSQLENADLTKATRDAMRSSGWKASWFKDVEAVEEAKAQMAEKQQMAEQMAAAQMMGGAAEQGGKGMKELAGAMDAAGKTAGA